MTKNRFDGDGIVTVYWVETRSGQLVIKSLNGKSVIVNGIEMFVSEHHPRPMNSFSLTKAKALRVFITDAEKQYRVLSKDLKRTAADIKRAKSRLIVEDEKAKLRKGKAAVETDVELIEKKVTAGSESTALSLMDTLPYVCKAKQMWGMYISFEGRAYGRLPIPAAPYLRSMSHYDIVCTGRGILLFEDREAMEEAFWQTVGESGPTCLNPYDGDDLVFAVTCSPDGEPLDENC